ncbi:MAG: NAD(P)H-dependent oxidoreductase [Planctomycetota bacterium]|nr:NAD(P)H-dependent oxidoreductase [Planctomycetota bacterium]
MKPRHASICLGTTFLALVGSLLSASAAVGGEDAPRTQPGQTPAVQVLVAYYSLTGNTERMAQAVAAGVQRVPGVVAIVKKVEDATKEDLENADGIILGSPTYFGDMAGKMKVVIDDWNWKLGVDFTDKVGGAFSTGGGPAGGKEHTVVSLLLFMINNRMVVAGPLYAGRTPNKGWAEFGGTAATGPSDPGISDVEFDTAQRVGERVARLAKKLQAK